MPRYFQTSNASRPYRAGASNFVFEPVIQVGGNWHGVLAVEESAAGILAAEKFPQIKEITEAEYLDAKKKPLAQSSSFYELRQSHKMVPVPPASPAAQSVPALDDKPAPAPAPQTEIKVARVEPPDELASLVQATKPKR